MSENAGWTDRLFGGLKKTSGKLTENIAGLVTKAKLDPSDLDEIEDALIASDLGPAMASQIRDKIAAGRFDRGVDADGIRQIVEDEIAAVLAPVASPLEIDAFPRPQVILVIGVNGSGKTTTIAKLANLFLEQDYGVMLAAGDTFRAAAIGQLKIWAERIGVPIVTGPEGGDAAGVVFDAVKKATAEGIDVLIVDTAGRLQNKRELMDELAKIRRVLGRLNPAAPHNVVLVLDATTGQNALSQIETFKEVADVTGLVMTKLDGSARGGILVAAAKQFGLPIHAIGVGESIDDLRTQFRQMTKMGGLGALAGMMPGMKKAKQAMDASGMNDKLLVHMDAIIGSMTPKERAKPELLNAKRKIRIAKGSGMTVQDVNKLIKMHQEMAGAMKRIRKMGGLKGLAAMFGGKGGLGGGGDMGGAMAALPPGAMPPGISGLPGMGGGGGIPPDLARLLNKKK